MTNDFAQITIDLSTEWMEHHRPGAPELYPEPLRDEIDEVNGTGVQDVNNGVYRCGFAAPRRPTTGVPALFAGLDWLSERLADRRYLVGETITEADVRLFTTLARFDAVYHGHFKCNRQKLSELPVLWAYARDLFQTPGFGDTIDFEQIKRHYYVVHKDINPTGIVPLGPDTVAARRTAARSWAAALRRRDASGSSATGGNRALGARCLTGAWPPRLPAGSSPPRQRRRSPAG